MPNILDYLKWRGDLTSAQAPFNDVDALILARLAYAPFDGIVPDFGGEPVPLSQAAETCIALVHDPGSARAFRIADDESLLTGLIGSPRFASLALTGFVNKFDAQHQEQFSATTVLLGPDAFFTAFRGTDGTIIGWKEDFNMGFADVVPAQLDAVAYLERAAAHLPGGIRVGGHSKGGNLAVYASAFCGQDVQERITHVRNNDGPGFHLDAVQKPGFQRIIPRIQTFLPQSSVVGMLLEHEEDFSIVHSTNPGILQHNVYSWEVERSGFVPAGGLTNSSQFIDRSLKDWVANMTPELREKMIDGVFSVLSASEGTTLRELWNGKNTIAVLRAMAGMDEQTRQLLKEAYGILRTSMKKSLPATLDSMLGNAPAVAKLLQRQPDRG